MRRKIVSQPASISEIHILHPFFSGPLSSGTRVRGVDYCAAGRQSAGTGGDFFDFIPLGGDTLVAAIGHAFGEDTSAALSTTGLQRLLHGLTAANCGEIARVVESLNRAICAVSPDLFYITLFYAWIDPVRSQLYYVNAAHEPAVLIHDQGARARMLDDTGPVLGATADARFFQHSVAVEPGDVLIALSGAKANPRRQERAAGIVRENPHLKAATLAARLLDELRTAVSVVRLEGQVLVSATEASAAEELLAAS